MILKTVVLFLLAMMVLGMFGKIRFPKSLMPKKASKPLKCARCGAHQIGKSPCPCADKG